MTCLLLRKVMLKPENIAIISLNWGFLRLISIRR